MERLEDLITIEAHPTAYRCNICGTHSTEFNAFEARINGATHLFISHRKKWPLLRELDKYV